VINQTLGTIKDIKLLGRESHVNTALGQEVDSLQRHECFYLFIGALPKLFLEVLAVATLLLVGGVFVMLGRPVQAMLPLLTLFGVAVVRLVPLVAGLNSSLTEFRYKWPAFDLVCGELKAVEGMNAQESPEIRMKVTPIKIQQSIRLEQIRYCYPGAVRESLHGISAQINTGEVIAFIGVSGSGKSTLIDILLGLIKPTSGCVKVDGIDIHQNLPSWQRQIGYVPQDIYLIDDSIRHNIAFGLADHEVNEGALNRALEAAQLDKFVRSLPNGPSTQVGNRGIRLSGGQRQRIGIARALYHEPGVLVMDEATNALDNETEQEVIEAISRLRGGRTIVMIAHRLSTVRSCDRLYLLEEGTVKDEGCFGDLVIRHENLRVGLSIAPDQNISVM
jgi:ATP-binding cassette subfamily C protein